MKLSCDTLGKYIQPVDVRNRDLGIDYLLGLSITKRFIPSIANTVGTDFTNYKIVKTGQFAYGPVTSRNGDKITIALLSDKDCIISSSYSVFEISDKKSLLPEYLMLWFMRPEFDRYARFKSHGSVREIFDWEEMCNVELPVPDITIQQSIVKAYDTIESRIKHLRQINDNLEDIQRDKAANVIACSSSNRSISMVLLSISEKNDDTLLSKVVAAQQSGLKTFSASKSLVTSALNTAPEALCFSTSITCFVRQKVNSGGYLLFPLNA